MKDKRTVAQILGENLKRIRTEKGVSRKDLAAAIKTTDINFGKYERGDTLPPLDKIFAAADFLKVSVASLTGENDFSDNVPNVAAFANAFLFEYRIKRAIDLATRAGCTIQRTDADKVFVKLPPEISTETNGKVSVTYDLKFTPIIFDDTKDFIDVMETVEKSALADNNIFLEKLRKAILKSK